MAGFLAVAILFTGFAAYALFTPPYLPPSELTDNEAALDGVEQVFALGEWEGRTEPRMPIPTARDPFAPPLQTTTIAVNEGDNLMGVLRRAGVAANEAQAAIRSLSGVFNPRRELRPGQQLRLTFDPNAGTAGAARPVLVSLKLPVAFDRDIAVLRDGGRFRAEEVERQLERRLLSAKGEIRSSLFVDGKSAGLPAEILVELIKIFSFDVDFQREMRAGDSFEVMFSQEFDEDGVAAPGGQIEYARLVLRGKPLVVYRFETSDGLVDYFNENGESVQKALLRTPIDGARVSSRFGMRRHPILGFSRMHEGIDFAAPRGTPIYAGGSGRIEFVGRNGGYGNYIRIRHNGSYKTAYAHMKGFARGLRVGSRVQQGQVIGYVGSTGSSTGPHLHYEVIQNGKKINPATLKLPSGTELAGAELERFMAARVKSDRRFRALGRGDDSVLMAEIE